MGDCASRPSSREIEEHMMQNNSINDYYFISIQHRDLEKSSNSIVLESHRNYYNKQKSKYQRGLGKLMDGIGWIPELNIEIQKGIGFESFTNCVSRATPYVTLRLQPNGPQLDTAEADPFRPSWYRIFQIKQKVFNYERVEFCVMAQKNMEVGCASFDFAELKDQKVRDLWLNSDKTQARVKVRVQYVHNKTMLLESLSKECDQCIHQLDSKLNK